MTEYSGGWVFDRSVAIAGHISGPGTDMNVHRQVPMIMQIKHMTLRLWDTPLSLPHKLMGDNWSVMASGDVLQADTECPVTAAPGSVGGDKGVSSPSTSLDFVAGSTILSVAALVMEESALCHFKYGFCLLAALTTVLGTARHGPAAVKQPSPCWRQRHNSPQRNDPSPTEKCQSAVSMHARCTTS